MTVIKKYMCMLVILSKCGYDVILIIIIYFSIILIFRSPNQSLDYLDLVSLDYICFPIRNEDHQNCK